MVWLRKLFSELIQQGGAQLRGCYFLFLIIEHKCFLIMNQVLRTA